MTPTFQDLVTLIEDPTRTSYQKAADLHALIQPAHSIPVLGTKPVRKTRVIKPKPVSNGTPPKLEGGA